MATPQGFDVVSGTTTNTGLPDIPDLEVQRDTQALYEEAAAFRGPPMK